jgi:hypothetical protein
MALSLRDDATTPSLYQNVPTIAMTADPAGTQAFSRRRQNNVHE